MQDNYQERTFISLQKKIYAFFPESTGLSLNQIIEHYKEMHPKESHPNTVWYALIAILKMTNSKELDFLIFKYAQETEKEQNSKIKKVA